jgi:hypothetical protein
MGQVAGIVAVLAVAVFLLWQNRPAGHTGLAG